MWLAFDVASHEDVRANAEDSYQRLADAKHALRRSLAAEQVERFRAWIDARSPP